MKFQSWYKHFIENIYFEITTAKWLSLFLHVWMCVGMYFQYNIYVLMPHADFNSKLILQHFCVGRDCCFYVHIYSWTGIPIFARELQCSLLPTAITICFLHITWFYPMLGPVSLAIFHDRNSNVKEMFNESIAMKFAYGTTAVLSCHEQTFVTIS